ncbi:copper homeostasis protein CutC [Lederbergia galactosidilytica]|uniref:PF03932 family protein CutC n=1 Tax=Lederbergia galactosidilytica TaxID=217031 RepID=A0A177ZIV6_9BACI|nr:copper homeostasis protein CutC [Lederbergia galactosidilytica]KRG16535.1 copper homeostasis protein CutC [Virgibacillus soli]MBP1914127.1 copper homeostasis protein [Lederbergia galactosidilytica]OAK67409.1 copper homeostasis protein CutC [Lederbergia galactosidilytica]
MQIEVIVQNFVDAIKAQELGADRLELVIGIEEGGLTPSYGIIKSVLNHIEIPVQVMVRPHGYSHIYSELEMTVMLDEIKYMHELGVKGIVIGAITPDHTVNLPFIESIIKAYPDLDITFHRAFDEVRSLKEAYESLIPYKKHVKRILTSGGESSCLEGIEQLPSLVQLAQELNGPQILLGGGLDPDNIENIHTKVMATQYHFGKGVRKQNSFQNTFDIDKMQKLQSVLK